MSAATWLALGGAVSVSALPSSRVARTGGLVEDGRLTATSGRASGWLASVASVRRPAWLVAVAVVVLVGWRGGPALGVASAAVLGVAGVMLGDLVRARRDARRHRALLTAVRVLAGELAAGVRPVEALAAAAQTSPDADRVLGAAARSAATDVAAALGESGEPALRGLAVAWQLAAASGAALAEVVERVAADLAARDDKRRAVAVAVAGPKSSAVLLSGLPLLGVALGAAMGAQPVSFLLGDPAGRALCCAGVLLDAAGVLWMRRIVRRVQP